MESAIGQTWQRRNSNTRVKVKDRMFHLGQWWVLLVIVNPNRRRMSWWTKERGFTSGYTLVPDAELTQGN